MKGDFHPQPRQEIDDDAARPRVLDNWYVQLLEEELANEEYQQKTQGAGE